MTRQILLGCWALHFVSATNSFFIAGYAIALRSSFVGPMPAAMQQMINYLFSWADLYTHLLVTWWNLMDKYLSDISLAEYLYRREYCPGLHLRLGNLPDDRLAIKMTRFNISQLRRLFQEFGLRDCVKFIMTNNFRDLTRAKKCYPINPEELFLYLLTRIKTGMT
jgi:hypothetical protein